MKQEAAVFIPWTFREHTWHFMACEGLSEHIAGVSRMGHGSQPFLRSCPSDSGTVCSAWGQLPPPIAPSPPAACPYSAFSPHDPLSEPSPGPSHAVPSALKAPDGLIPLVGGAQVPSAGLSSCVMFWGDTLVSHTRLSSPPRTRTHGAGTAEGRRSQR